MIIQNTVNYIYTLLFKPCQVQKEALTDRRSAIKSAPQLIKNQFVRSRNKEIKV